MREQFVPRATKDPQGFFPTVPLVWGVFPDRFSDQQRSWILRAKGTGRVLSRSRDIAANRSQIGYKPQIG